MTNQANLFTPAFSPEQLKRREDVILKQATTFIAEMQTMTPGEIPHFLVYGILDWSWCLRFVKSNEMYRGFRFYSKKALEEIRAGETKFRRDHIVPKKLVKEMLLGLDHPTETSVRDILGRFGEVCVITLEEDAKLNAAGLNNEMPSDWTNDKDVFARYKSIGIEWTENKIS